MELDKDNNISSKVTIKLIDGRDINYGKILIKSDGITINIIKYGTSTE